ncbi:sigma-70 family RNA polymerase sigma factor [Arcticibacterium luteifluviistationis]|uniref:Uncharacterized protein n=1 Tax=Arcticibacterium luteifluviistationis TaxID=1784714 RepID=A0A2Z4G9B1_9BACT|nr:sigma-70 family RNA polymerase sigma factor [Arcticibacterium luteifluviistationis]AWV97685.1 hypothetical protein DJ013_05700 [Arcticibacterium luteifluviistationis]
MASLTDNKIVDLLRSDKISERNKGGLLFEKSFKSKSISYLKKSFKGVSYEDVWQEAAAQMIVNIVERKYNPIPNASMFTYFYFILKSEAIKESGFNNSATVDIRDLEIEDFNKHYDPFEILRLKEFRKFFSECLKRQKEPYVQLLKNIYMKGLRLKDFHEELGIETYSNAKVKHFTGKKKLLTCLKSKLDYGDK